MSKTKIILRKYFENSYSKEIQSQFASWLNSKNETDLDEGLNEIWNNINITASDSTHEDLRQLKERVGLIRPNVSKFRIKPQLIKIAAYISAACIIAIVSILLISKFNNSNIDRDSIFSQLNSLNVDSVQATAIVVDNVITYTDDDLIEQTIEGNIVINKEKISTNKVLSDMVQVFVPKGKRTQVHFNDGTKAWLNSGSKLIYPKKFEDKKRELFINGEIYLDVAKDSERPFIVNTSNMNIKVLGTEFNIRSYSEEYENSVVLVKGKVEIESTDKKQRETLTPNQAIFYKDKKIEKKEVDVNSYICWRDGELRLDGESLNTIFDRLTKNYNINIVYKGKETTTQYKGKLFLGNSIEEVLDAIALKVKFSYIVEKDTIYITDMPNEP